MENDDTDNNADIVIGLDVRGQMFYCNKTKLLNANNGSSYFSARFRDDSMLDAGLDRVDDEGRHIYKLDRDPSIFRYIMEYIDTNKKPIGIGAYEINKRLWSLVREEALYFGLDSLVQLMKITFSCSPEDNGDKGIMYWLGTKKGCTSDYVNPYSRGAVDISKWSNEGDVEEIDDDEETELMVQYRPNPEGDAFDNSSSREMLDHHCEGVFGVDYGIMMGCYACDLDDAGGSISFHLLNGVAVCPTHYSIRHGGCYGMAGDWNFEGSFDGKSWDVLHQSRLRYAALYGNVYGDFNQTDKEEFANVIMDHEGFKSRKDAICDYMEKNHRQIITVSYAASKRYTHFRFLSIALHKSDVEVGRENCLHGIGFELYGNVYEEWVEESKSRIEQLEVENEVLPASQNEMQQAQIKDLTDQNEKLRVHNQTLLSEVESLKARVRQLENKRSAEEACLPER